METAVQLRSRVIQKLAMVLLTHVMTNSRTISPNSVAEMCTIVLVSRYRGSALPPPLFRLQDFLCLHRQIFKFCCYIARYYGKKIARGLWGVEFFLHA